jgi:hypothetical protein
LQEPNSNKRAWKPRLTADEIWKKEVAESNRRAEEKGKREAQGVREERRSASPVKRRRRRGK